MINKKSIFLSVIVSLFTFREFVEVNHGANSTSYIVGSQLNAKFLAFLGTYLTIGYRLIYVVLTVRFPSRKFDFSV